MSNSTILIAETQKIISLDLKRILEKNNFHISSNVSTGEDLLNQYKLKKPDLIITNLKLDGKVSCTDAIREINKLDSTPIIVLSASSEKRLKKFTSSLLFCEFLVKPFDDSELLALINKCIQSKDGHK